MKEKSFLIKMELFVDDNKQSTYNHPTKKDGIFILNIKFRGKNLITRSNPDPNQSKANT